MGRLRARLAKNEIDRELHGHLAEAERRLERAMETCRKIPKDNRQSSRRAEDTLRTLAVAVGVIRRIGSLISGVDLEDPDLISSNERARERRKEKVKEREEARRGTLPVLRGSRG